MPRLFLSSISAEDKAILITGENSRYLLNVLKMSTGDEFTVFDSTGAQYRAEVKRVGKTNVVAELKEALPPAPEPVRKIILLQGILKGKKMDYVVQKATELGVAEIVPVVTKRSQVRNTRKQERWQKIALEASRQSHRTRIPDVKEPIRLEEYFKTADGLKGFIFWEEGGVSLREVAVDGSNEPIVVAIGPEGGFTADEVDIARKGGLVVASLGNRILRAETAAVSALTVVQFILGEMG